MQISTVTAYKLDVPLAMKFKHSQAEHSVAENIVVETRLDDGTAGFGNSLPRSSVTGESCRDVLDNYKAQVSSALKDNYATFESVVDMLLDDQLVTGGFETSLAGRCAVELSLLDAFGKHFNRSAGDAVLYAYPEIVYPQPVKRVRYCVGISNSIPRRELKSVLKYFLAGFRSIKLKTGLCDAEDLKKTKLIRRFLGNHVEIHADANGAWSLGQAIRMCRELGKLNVTSMEQPLAKGDETNLPELCRSVEMPIMLDESLTSQTSARQAIDGNWCQLFNIRISKCGGLLRSCQLVKMAGDNGLGFQLGCQVGETGILSAAGRAFAVTVRGAKYLEGSYDKYLLADNVLKKDISLKYGGKAPRLTGPGLGIEVDPEGIERLAVDRLEFTL